MDERRKYVEVFECTNVQKVTGNTGNVAHCCGGTKLNIFLVYKFAILGKTLQSIFFFHNAVSVLSKKQKNPDIFLCCPKTKYFENLL